MKKELSKKLILGVLIILSFVTFPVFVKAAVIDDEYYDYQEYLNKIGYYPYVKDFSMGKNVVVAVIDNGVWLEHPDLTGSAWINKDEDQYNNKDDDSNGYIDDYYGWNFIDNNNDLVTKGSHGTGVAGVISANSNSIGIIGIAPESKIMPLIVCDETGCEDDIVISAIKYAVDNGADIINLSLGSSGYVGYNSEYDQIIGYAYDNGVVVVAAAGNGDIESLSYTGQDLNFAKVSPASNDVNDMNTVLGVGALNALKKPTSWSNYGKGVDVYVQGEDIVSLSVPIHSDGASYR